MAGGGGKNKKRFSNAQIIAALIEHDGVIPRAAEKLKTSPQAITQRIDRSTEIQEAIAQMETDLKATVRGNIARAIKAGDSGMSRWYAERKMRDEGYGTQIAVGVDEAQIARIAEAIASAGINALRAVQAAIAGSR